MSTTMNHTPAPWHLHTANNVDAALTELRGSDGNFLATFFNDPNAADARLIKAAPLLLDALVMALPYIEDLEHDPAYKPNAINRAVRQIKTAITAATKEPRT